MAKMPSYFTNTHHSCESGVRPVVVVSSNVGNRTADIVMVCPITHSIKPLSCNATVGWSKDGRTSQVLCNQVITLPKESLKEYCGFINSQDQREVERALCISFGIYLGERKDNR